MPSALTSPRHGARQSRALADLARLLAAGIDVDRALTMLAERATPGLRRAVVASRRARADGVDLVDALARGGLLPARTRPMLAAFAATGRLERGLEAVAAEADDRERLRGRLRRGLLLPAALIVVAAATAPLPALVAGDLTGAAYIGRVLLPVAGLAAFGALALRCAPALGARLADYRLALGRPATLAQRLGVMRGLGALLAGGVDAATALGTLARCHPGALGRRLHGTRTRVAAGQPVTTALAANGLLGRPPEPALLAAAETAGRLPETLDHRAGQLAGDLADRRALIATWLPRAAYALVVVAIAASLI